MAGRACPGVNQTAWLPACQECGLGGQRLRSLPTSSVNWQCSCCWTMLLIWALNRNCSKRLTSEPQSMSYIIWTCGRLMRFWKVTPTTSSAGTLKAVVMIGRSRELVMSSSNNQLGCCGKKHSQRFVHYLIKLLQQHLCDLQNLQIQILLMIR